MYDAKGTTYGSTKSVMYRSTLNIPICNMWNPVEAIKLILPHIMVDPPPKAFVGYCQQPTVSLGDDIL